MKNSTMFRKITGPWLKLVVWLLVLAGMVILQSGAFRAVEVSAEISVKATVNQPTLEKVLPGTGPVDGNTRVSISGTNLENVIAVTFNGVTAPSFIIESPSLITTLTPPGQPGAVKVVIVTQDTAVALKEGFTYIAPVSPTTTATPAPATTSPATGITATVAASTTPVITTPIQGQITGSPQASSPGPTITQVTITGSPTAAVSPTATSLTATPTGSPTAAVSPTPSGSPAVTPATAAPDPSPAVISPTATLAITPTGSPRPSTPGTPTATPGPTTTTQVSPAMTATLVPASPSISPTNAAPSITPAGSVTPSGTPSTPGLTPGTLAATVKATGTPAASVTPTVIVVPTPTAIVAPTGTAAASPSPSPTAVIAGPPAITKVSPATGPATGGTAVVITGVNFTDQTKVTFGGLNPVSVTYNSPTQLTAVTAPQPAGTVSVVVKTEFGLAQVANGFTYTAGKVVLSQPATNFNYSGKLTGGIITLNSSFSVGVNDATGLGAGWRLVAQSTILSSGKAIIPVENHTIQNVRVVTKSGVPPINKINYPLVFPTSHNTIFLAAANSGTGESIITFDTQLLISPDIPAGNYTLSLNVSVEPVA